ncbi:CRISPR-associated protein [Streptomonospora wellingtoniae]|uniref:CRISPR-associated protein n=1 Tax=Streptomonospora wellingtoniae TaxID=3075544 RepID=A0ABU2KUX0_9ACTN|nr:CRISPR-associated protein [Streptomonospora sp. DSM 45055]MDT0303096.1 CRISPR-associated protein [Streptomonospora sp. DSM 45055]
MARRADLPGGSDGAGVGGAPATLVVLAGTSPTPALLAALTFAPRRLVLVHSSDTARRAARIAAAARRLCPAVEAARLFDAGGDVFDFRAVAERFAALSADLRGDWRLCYTGGSKVMSAHAVLLHAERFPDRHRWRSYLDATSETLRFTDGSRHDTGIASSALTVEELARLHGVELRPSDRAPAQEAWLRSRSGDARPGGDKHSGSVEAPRVRGTAEGTRLGSGEMAEAKLLALFRRRLARVPGAEVLGSRVMPDPRSERDAIGDFDLIVRYRHRVLCVEVKRDPSHIPDAAGWTLTKAQRAFGGAARVLFVHDGTKGDCSTEQIAAYDPELSGAPLHVRSLGELASRDFGTARRLIEAFFPAAPPPPRSSAADRGAPAGRSAPATAGAPDPCPADQDAEAAAAPLLLAGLGGNRLPVLGTARACLPRRAVMLFTRQSEKELPALDASVRRTLLAAEEPEEFRNLNRRRLAQRLRRGGYPDRVKFAEAAVDGADVADTAARARAKIDLYGAPDAPVVADITTGTKAMSTGLALAAHESGGCLVYVSPLTRRVSCRTHGPVGHHPPAAVEWRHLLRGYRFLHGALTETVAPEIAARQIDAPLIDAAAEQVRELAAPAEVAAWVDATAVAGAPALPQYSAPQRPTLILTAADRALGLSAPRRTRLRYFTSKDLHVEQETGGGGWAHDVFAAAALLNVRCGTAGLTAALHRPGDGDPGRALELIDWFAWWRADGGAPVADDSAPPAEMITGHEDTRRPRVVSAEPGTPGFRAALQAQLTALRL